MIQTLNQITINGAINIWNGYIYNINYQPSFGQTPSFCTVNLISEDGTYSIQESDLQVTSAHTINIGSNITLTMYPVRYKIKQDSSGKTLEVRYEDTSVILDKKIVVLNGRQGNDGTAFPINPISANPPTYPNDKFAGSCYIPVGQEILQANQTYNNVLDIVYNFAQLCDAIATNGIIINSDSYSLIQNSNQYYFAGYIGTLRNVLSQWCTDLAYGYYWENGSIHFIDLSTPLILDTSTFDNAVQDAQSIEVSIEDTVGRVACAFYGQDKQLLGPTPGQNTALSFKCITLATLGFNPDQIGIIKACYFGEQTYYTYCYYLTTLNNPTNIYNQTLGVQARTPFSLPGTATAALDNNQTVFTQYSYCLWNTVISDSNYKFYNSYVPFVGRFYYLPMTYGDYKSISSWEYGNPQFFKQDLPCSQCGELGKLAAMLGNGDATIGSFCIGQPFSVSSLAAEANTTESTSNYAYDNTDGIVVLDMGEQNWFSNGLPFSQKNASDALDTTTLNYYPMTVSQTQDSIVKALNADLPPNSQNVLQTQQNNYNLYLLGVVFNSQGINFNLQSPEDLYADRLVNCFISNNNQNILPLIEEFFRSETDKTGNTVNCYSNTVKNELNFRNITNIDMLALGAPEYGSFGAILTAYGIQLALPAANTVQNLEEAFQLFTQNLTLSKTDPTIVKTYSLPYIDLPNNYQPLIGKGLMGLQIKMDDKGVNSTYTIGTRLMQVPSIESIRMNIEFQHRTNESRFLPYGYYPALVV